MEPDDPSAAAWILVSRARPAWIVALQIRESSLRGATRPCAPAACPLCRGCQFLQCHGAYERYADCSGDTKIAVARFLCPRCGHTFSVLPAGHLPYRALPVARLEAGLDALCAPSEPPPKAPPPSMGGDARPPPISEVEQGCFKRAGECLLRRIPVLRGCFGQQLPVLANDDLCGFWIALRAIGRTEQTLRFLAEHFKTSLLAHYRCLCPPWAREVAPS